MISRPHKNRWYFLIQVFFYFYFAFCGNEILLSSQNRKSDKREEVISQKPQNRSWHFQACGREPARRGRWGSVTPSPLLCQGKAEPPRTQRPGKCSALSHQQHKDIKSSSFYSQERMPIICLFSEYYLKTEGYLTIFMLFQRLYGNTIKWKQNYYHFWFLFIFPLAMLALIYQAINQRLVIKRSQNNKKQTRLRCCLFGLFLVTFSFIFCPLRKKPFVKLFPGLYCF